MKATYNITNDKLMVWFDDRLSEPDYARAKRHSFQWWPGRKCFAAKWSPGAEDFVKSFGITIAEDDTPDDVESRVDRFAGRAAEAERASASSQKYLESERCNTERRRKNAVNGVERGLDEATHWHERVAASIRHAAYRERTDVIGRRIKGLEADQRKMQKTMDQAVTLSTEWDKPDLDLKRALHIANYYDHTSACFPKSKYPASTYEGSQTLWGALDKGVCTVEQAREIALANHKRTIEWTGRWLVHLEDRLVYEKAVYFASGGTEEDLHPPRRKGMAAVPLLNIDVPSIAVREMYARRGSTQGEVYEVRRMTKAEYTALREDQRGGWLSACGTFRVRIGVTTQPYARFAVFLTDSKEHPMPKKESDAAA